MILSDDLRAELPEWLRPGRKVSAHGTEKDGTIWQQPATLDGVQMDEAGAITVLVDIPGVTSHHRPAGRVVFTKNDDGEFVWRNVRLAPPFQNDDAKYLPWLHNNLCIEVEQAVVDIHYPMGKDRLVLIGASRTLLNQLEDVYLRCLDQA